VAPPLTLSFSFFLSPAKEVKEPIFFFVTRAVLTAPFLFSPAGRHSLRFFTPQIPLSRAKPVRYPGYFLERDKCGAFFFFFFLADEAGSTSPRRGSPAPSFFRVVSIFFLFLLWERESALSPPEHAADRRSPSFSPGVAALGAAEGLSFSLFFLSAFPPFPALQSGVERLPFSGWAASFSFRGLASSPYLFFFSCGSRLFLFFFWPQLQADTSELPSREKEYRARFLLRLRLRGSPALFPSSVPFFAFLPSFCL